MISYELFNFIPGQTVKWVELGSDSKDVKGVSIRKNPVLHFETGC